MENLILLAALLLVVVLFGGMVYAVRRIGARRPAGERDEVVDAPNIAAVAAALIAALVMSLAVFLPRFDAHVFVRIKENTLIQAGDGWILVLLAIGILAAALRVGSNRLKGQTVMAAGFVAIALAIYDGTGDRLKLAGGLVSEHADAGSGIYAAGLGGLLAVIAGSWFMRDVDLLRARRMKTCPDCAELVLADAQVCKHCGRRDPAT